jgi:predicted regulator of Ras-like GTPase activity (Roadblock/LC7/MglB family)
VRQALIEMRDSYLILTAAGPGAHLAVLTNQGADVGVVAYQMNMLVKKIGEHLRAAPRAGVAAAADNGE